MLLIVLQGGWAIGWFAYLGFSEPALKILSSYPAPWAQQYFEQRYEDIDPVVGLAPALDCGGAEALAGDVGRTVLADNQ